MEREGAKYTNSNSNISWEKLPSMNFLQCFDSTSEGGRRSRPNHRLAIIRHSLNVPVTYNEYTFYLTFIRNHHRAATGARYNLLSEQSKADIAIRVNHHTATGNHMPSHSLTCHPAAVTSRLYPSRSWYSIYQPRRDARLSWPGWWLRTYIPR